MAYTNSAQHAWTAQRIRTAQANAMLSRTCTPIKMKQIFICTKWEFLPDRKGGLKCFIITYESVHCEQIMLKDPKNCNKFMLGSDNIIYYLLVWNDLTFIKFTSKELICKILDRILEWFRCTIWLMLMFNNLDYVMYRSSHGASQTTRKWDQWPSNLISIGKPWPLLLYVKL